MGQHNAPRQQEKGQSPCDHLHKCSWRSDKFLHPSGIETSRQKRTGRELLEGIKHLEGNPAATTTVNGERLNAFPLRPGTRPGYPFFYLFFSRFYLLIFRERGKEGEREGEKHQSVVASSAPPTGDLARNPGMCPDWELNRRPFGPQPALNPLSYTGQGQGAHSCHFHSTLSWKFRSWQWGRKVKSKTSRLNRKEENRVCTCRCMTWYKTSPVNIAHQWCKAQQAA